MSDHLLKVDFTVRGFPFPAQLFGRPLERALRQAGDDLDKELAEDFLKFLKKKLLYNELRLIPLTPSTISMKAARGNSAPESPMYGKGTSSASSYIGNLTVRKVKAGMRVGVDGRKKHHSGLSMSKLAILHAGGYTVRRTGAKVPPRNPIQAALDQYDPKIEKSIMKLLAKHIRKAWKL